ncbi:MAG: mannonate dehydratase [bacterium]|nr:mannonate dehydratase [bacterium]
MKSCFRWFGENDPVPLQHIRQIPGVAAIVTSIQTGSIGDIISDDRINRAKNTIEAAGMKFEVIESLAVHNDIKLGTEQRDVYIENYKANIKKLAEAGIKVIVYNFRPIFRWARTEIYKQLEDQSTVSVYYKDDEKKIDPFHHSIHDSPWYRENSRYIYERQLTTDLKLDGYYTPESVQEMTDLRGKFQILGKDGLWDNLGYFLKEIIPVAEGNGVKMALHPDDPPWDIFGVPRLMVNEEAFDTLLNLYNSDSNTLLFCSGTIASNHTTDVYALADKYTKMKKVAFAHIRNVKTGEEFVEESAHYSPYGSINMVRLLSIFSCNRYEGYIRSDHGRMIWGEEGKPGNGIYDRALGLQYIQGIWETLKHLSR